MDSSIAFLLLLGIIVGAGMFIAGTEDIDRGIHGFRPSTQLVLVVLGPVLFVGCAMIFLYGTDQTA